MGEDERIAAETIVEVFKTHMEKVTERERERGDFQRTDAAKKEEEETGGEWERWKKREWWQGREGGIISPFLFLPLLHCITKTVAVRGKRRRTMERWGRVG